MIRILLSSLLLLPFTAMAQLNGTYTVGGSNPDFATPADAFDAVMLQGATGFVELAFRPGTYTGQYTIGAFPGGGLVNIRSESGDADDVIFAYDATDQNDNHIFEIDGAENLSFQQVTFAPQDFTYARAIVFRNGCHQLGILECVFIGSQNTSGSGYFRRILLHADQQDLGQAGNSDNVSIFGNSFFHGNTAIQLDFYGIGGLRAQGLSVSNNVLKDQVGTGMVIDNAVGFVNNNHISTTVGDFYVGIRCFHLEDGSQLYGNVVQALATNDCSALEFSNTQNTSGTRIYNNLLYAQGTTQVWGLAVYNLWGVEIVHNSVLVEGGDPGQSRAFHHLSSFSDGQDTELRNNIFSNRTGGYALNVTSPGNVALEDHNVLHTTGTTLAAVGTDLYAQLSDYQTGTGMGAGDQEVDPVFALAPDLHMNNCVLDGTGTPVAYVQFDADSEPRSATAPDPGADEYMFNAGPFNAPSDTVQSGQLPLVLTAPDGGPYTWSTGETTQSINVNMTGTYTCSFTDVNGCTYAITYTVVVETSTGIVGVDEHHGLLGHPNPATSSLTIPSATGNTPYTVFTTDGRMLRTGTLRQQILDVEDLASGSYLLLLRIGDHPRTLRFTVVE